MNGPHQESPFDDDLTEAEDVDDAIMYAAFGPDATPRAPRTPPQAFPSREVLPGDELGPYRLEAEIGRGGQGFVFRAVHTRTGRTVAVKILRSLGGDPGRTLAYFKREAEIAARLDHPGLCPVYDAEVAGGVPYLSMRYLEGETLARKITGSRRRASDVPSTCVLLDVDTGAETGSPGPERTEERQPASTSRDDLIASVKLVEDAARALHVAHEAGIVHRDIKPGNIMIAPDGQAVIMDFGLARGDDAEFANLTRSGDVFGTPLYMSPEQLEDTASSLDRRTDVWALGVTLYECLTLQRPFDAPTRDALYQAVLHEEATSPRRHNAAIPKDLETVVLTALEKNRDRRYQTALDLAEDLRRVRCFEPISARPVTRWTRLVRWTQRNPALASSLTLLLIAICAGGIVSFMQAREARRQAHDAQRHLTEWERLADGRRLADLVRAADETLWPATPDRLDEIRAWIEDAELLTRRLPDHTKALEALRGTALPWSADERAADAGAQENDRLRVASIDEEDADLARRAGNLDRQLRGLRDQRATIARRDPLTRRDEQRLELLNTHEARIQKSRTAIAATRAELARERERLSATLGRRATWTFDDPRDQIRHDGLWEIVDGLRGLRAPADPARVTIDGMRDRLALAGSIERHTILQPAQAWAAVARRVSENPRYHGLRLTPQLGLVPIGPDPETTLEEFAHVATGDVPERESDGSFRYEDRHAVVLVLLPGGSFDMGVESDDDATGTRSAKPAMPQHRVTLDAFFASKFELTQAQWRRLSGTNPSSYNPRVATVNLTNPVTNVSWTEFTERLRRVDLVLPTEAQWEYACRAGTSTSWWPGDELASLAGVANLADQSGVALGLTWKDEPQMGEVEDGHLVHAPAQTFKPNPFGLHHTHGNVWEWCRDWYRPYDAFTARPGDGLRGETGTLGRVLRGGGFKDDPKAALSGFRGLARPGLKDDETGARPARALQR